MRTINGTSRTKIIIIVKNNVFSNKLYFYKKKNIRYFILLDKYYISVLRFQDKN